LARISSSRHSLYRRLWLSGFRAEPFFPLSPRRPYWITHRQTAPGLSAARLAAYVPSGIIRTRSRHSELSLPATSSGRCLTVPAVDAPDSLRCPRLHRLCRMSDVNGWGRFATGRPAVPRAGVRQARCSASSPAIQGASDRFRFLRRTGNKAPGTSLLCSVPAGADKIDGGDCDKQQRLAGGSPRPRAQSGKHPPHAQFCPLPQRPPLLQITAQTRNTCEFNIL
jgi:hypothetical protein